MADGSKGVCGLCVGLLQKPAVDKLAADVDAAFAMNSFNPDEPWSFALNLPVSTMFRNFVLLSICEREKIPESDRNQISDMKFAVKQLFQHVFQTAFDKYAKVGVKSLGPFKISVDATFPGMDKHKDIEKLLPDERKWFGNFKRRKQNKSRKPTTDMNHASVSRALEGLGPKEIAKVLGGQVETLENFISSPILTDLEADNQLQVKLKLEREAFFMLGRYNKYNRALSQTPWVLDGERKTPDSVEELVANPVIRAYGATSFKFHSAGREDVDVRMLGGGREFVLEMFDCRHPPSKSMSELEQEVEAESDGRVTINRLQESDKTIMAKLHSTSIFSYFCFNILVLF